MKPFLAIGGVFTALATLYFVMGNASKSRKECWLFGVPRSHWPFLGVPSDLSGGSVSLTAGLFDDWKTLDLTKTPLPSLTSSKEIDVKSDTVEILVRRINNRLQMLQNQHSAPMNFRAWAWGIDQLSHLLRWIQPEKSSFCFMGRRSRPRRGSTKCPRFKPWRRSDTRRWRSTCQVGVEERVTELKLHLIFFRRTFLSWRLWRDPKLFWGQGGIFGGRSPRAVRPNEAGACVALHVGHIFPATSWETTG